MGAHIQKEDPERMGRSIWALSCDECSSRATGEARELTDQDWSWTYQEYEDGTVNSECVCGLCNPKTKEHYRVEADPQQSLEAFASISLDA